MELYEDLFKAYHRDVILTEFHLTKQDLVNREQHFVFTTQGDGSGWYYKSLAWTFLGLSATVFFFRYVFDKIQVIKNRTWRVIARPGKLFPIKSKK